MTTLDYFSPTLPDLQDALPSWWRKYAPEQPGERPSNAYAVLVACAAMWDDLAAAFEQAYLDNFLETASLAGLYSEWAWIYDIQQEVAPLLFNVEQLRSYIESRIAEDGSLESVRNTLLALITLNPANLGGPVLTFPPGPLNLVHNPSAEYNATSGVSSTAGTYLNAGATISQAGVAAPGGGSHSFKIVTDGVASAEGIALTLDPVTGGQLYTAQVELAGDVGGEQVSVLLVDPATLDHGAAQAVTLTTGWTPVTVQWTPSSSRTAPVLVVRDNRGVGLTFDAGGAGLTFPAVAAMTFYVDEAIAEQASSISGYRDGDSPNNGWSGTAGNSSSGPALIFPADGSGLPLYQYASVPPATNDLIFPIDGSGLTFPDPAAYFPDDGSGFTFDSGGAGFQWPPFTPLLFGQDPWLTITVGPSGTFTITVQVKSYLAFDRSAFKRAMARSMPAHTINVYQEVNS